MAQNDLKNPQNYGGRELGSQLEKSQNSHVWRDVRLDRDTDRNPSTSTRHCPLPPLPQRRIFIHFYNTVADPRPRTDERADEPTHGPKERQTLFQKGRSCVYAELNLREVKAGFGVITVDETRYPQYAGW